MQHVNLMLHCGGKEVDLEQVQKTRTPERTESWVPVPHINIIEAVREAMQNTGLVVQHEAHALAGDNGVRYFGLMQVGMPNREETDHALVVGLRNSHDQKFRAGLAVGSGVFVCDNLAFSSDIVIGRKHTTNINRDLPGLVHRAVGQLGAHRQLQDKRFAAYKTHELNDVQADHLICEMYRAGVLTTSKMGPVIEEWKAPRHPEFIEEGKTAWRLLNATTEVLKGRMATIQKETMTLHGILDKETGIYNTELRAAA